MTAAHRPDRPSWDCTACAKPWPCALARDYLAADTGGGASLAMLMWIYLEDYCGDRPEGPLGDVFDRFIAWTRHGRPGR
ncbi:hypothetical protein [Krasilnikovia sp. MM14-A1259]|uniref:hypothetical protein n=1 Tax=Krasilnikovia sp. MM14-A1259 TaxID=3373539 RepID=UPI003825ACA4